MNPTIILERKVPGLSRSALETFVVEASRAARLHRTVTVLVTGNSQIRLLNSRFRAKKQSTDVLSFPAPEFANGFAGDIAVSVDFAARNARLLGHSIAQEVQILVLHGILHLAGYDHESDAGEMARKEQALRRRLLLPTGLIERSSVPPTHVRRAMRRSKFVRRRT